MSSGQSQIHRWVLFFIYIKLDLGQRDSLLIKEPENTLSPDEMGGSNHNKIAVSGFQIFEYLIRHGYIPVNNKNFMYGSKFGELVWFHFQ